MTRLLNSLVISNGEETLRALEKIMAINLEGYTLSFLSTPLGAIDNLDRIPDLIFIDNGGRLPIDDAYRIMRLFPRSTCLVLDDENAVDRAALLRAGISEVMSMADLNSALGKHMLEKLIAFKDLADAEVIIAQSEERFKGVIEHSHDIIMLLDADATIVYTSPAFRRQMNYEEWEVLGQDFTAYLHDDNRDDIAGELAHIMSAPPTEAAELEFRFRTAQGAWRHFEAIVTNLLNNATVQSVVVNMRDVTDQKKAEAELEEYRLHLEDLVAQRTKEVAEAHRQADTVVAASPDALIAIDDDGYITFISEHYRHTYRNSAHLLAPGQHIHDAFAVVTREIGLPEYDPRYKDMMDWWSDPKGSKEFMMNNGTWVRLQARRMQDDRGTVIATTNITDYKRQQTLLAAKSDDLEAALVKERAIVEQQKTFVSMVSHEFRTPLTIIDGNAQIIENRGAKLDKEALKSRAATIRVAVDRLVHLIEAFLSAHMLDSGKLNVSIADCSIEKVLLAAITEQQALSPRHRIRYDLRDLPKKMQADEKVLRQILTNVLSNAIKYSPGAEQVEIKAFGSGNKVLIEVQDHGVGIPEKELPRIADKYFRASTSGAIPGTGLGLNLVRQFVDLHGGKLTIRSKVGQGTCVTIALPVTQSVQLKTEAV